MTRSILISIKPNWCAKILNGEKTIEIRKTAPKCDLPIDVYIYCAKKKPYLGLYKQRMGFSFPPTHYVLYDYDIGEYNKKKYAFNGHVVAKFTLREVEHYVDGACKTVCPDEYLGLLNDSCLQKEELEEYAGIEMSFYAWYISDLQIFDEPMELSDFKYKKNRQRLGLDYHWHVEKSGLVPVKRAPESWQYVYADVPNNPHKIVH